MRHADCPVGGMNQDTPNNPQPTPQDDKAMAPGDQAPPGTPGTGEAPCRECGGSGRVGNETCKSCLGTGKVNVGIGGA